MLKRETKNEIQGDRRSRRRFGFRGRCRRERVFSKTRVVDGLDNLVEAVDATKYTLRTLKNEIELPLKTTLTNFERDQP